MPSLDRNYSFFGHVFESAAGIFYYDVSCQQILELDPALAAVLLNSDLYQTEDFPCHLLNRFSKSTLRKAIQVLETGRQIDGLFLSHRPRLVPGKIHSFISDEYAIQLQHLVLTLTENCNLRCRYCVHGADLDWVRPHGQRVMSVETALQATRYFLDRCTPKKIPAISFYGGESLLQIEVIRAVVGEVRGHPRGHSAHLVIDTNGVLLDDEIINLIVEYGLYLQISLDGPKSIHDRQRTDVLGGGTYDRIMAALDKLLTRDPSAHERLSFICTVTPPADLLEMDDFFSNFPPYVDHGLIQVPQLRVNAANLEGQNWPANEAAFNDLGRQFIELREVYFQAVASGERNGLGPVVKSLVEPSLFRLYHRSRAQLGETYTPGGNCLPGIRKLHVMVDGRLQPCERTGDSLQLGHIDQGIDTAGVQEIQDEFFNAVKTNCTDCWALRLCRVCYAGWSEQGGFGAKVPESLCQSVRSSIEADLQMLVRILDLPAELREYLDEVEIV